MIHRPPFRRRDDLEIGARGECAAGAGQHQNANLAVLRGRREHVACLDDHPVRHPVHALGSIQRQRRDRPGLLVSDGLQTHLGHGGSPFQRANRGA